MIFVPFLVPILHCLYADSYRCDTTTMVKFCEFASEESGKKWVEIDNLRHNLMMIVSLFFCMVHKSYCEGIELFGLHSIDKILHFLIIKPRFFGENQVSSSFIRTKLEFDWNEKKIHRNRWKNFATYFNFIFLGTTSLIYFYDFLLFNQKSFVRFRL